MESKSKTWLWLAVTAIIVAAAYWLWLSYLPAKAPESAVGPALSADDTTNTIEQELNTTNLDDLEKELQSTEADLNSL